MYHSPGLRDGVSSQGTCVRPALSNSLEQNQTMLAFHSIGINSGPRESSRSAGFFGTRRPIGNVGGQQARALLHFLGECSF